MTHEHVPKPTQTPETLPQHSAAEYEALFQQPSLDQEVAILLESEQTARLPLERQGEVIVDGFIGMVVRHGGVEAQSGTFDPLRILDLADKVRTREDILKFTRTDGLRGAIDALALDERTAKLFGQLGARLKGDDKGELTLTTPEQVVAYIGSGDNHVEDPHGQQVYGSDWIMTLMERATAEDGMLWIDNPNRGMIESDNDYLRREGIKWRNAVMMATRAGLDLDLLARSSKHIQAMSRRRQNA